jgi:hypothetical protein
VADLPVLVDPRGTPRVLAALPPYPWQPIPRLMETRAPLPRSEWREIDLAGTYKPPLLDQGRTNSCVGHASCTVASVAWAQKGEPLPRFSPTFVYSQINGGRDNGAVISDAATELTTKGICLEAEYPEGVLFARQVPPGAYQTALRYRLERFHHTPSFDEIGTALSLGWPVVGGFLLGNNFMQPGRDGVAPVPDRVVGGHAIALLGLVNRGGRWLVKFQNSWGRWGLGGEGFGYLPEEFVQYTVEVTMRQWGAPLDAFAAEHMYDDPANLEPVARDAA